MAVLANIKASAHSPHRSLMVDQLDDLIPLDYYEPSPLGSSLVKLLCLDLLQGIDTEQYCISLDPAHLSWLPDFVEVLDEEYQRAMAVVNGAEENGAMHDRELEAQLLAIGRRGFKVRIVDLPEYAEDNPFPGLELLIGKEYLVRSHLPEPDQEPLAEVPLVYTATPDGHPIDLTSLPSSAG